MTFDNSTNRPDRRKFLRTVRDGMLWTAALGMTGVAGYEGYVAMNPFKTVPAGDESHPVYQQNVNQTYADLYAHIKTAKSQAQQSNKSLVIIVGEDHVRNLSLLNNLMVIDIAARLGIQHYIQEGTLSGQTLETDDDRKTAVFIHDDMPAMRTAARYLDSERDKVLFDCCTRGIRLVTSMEPREQEKERDQHGVIELVFRDLCRFTTYAGDPNNSNPKPRLSPEVEHPMAKAIHSINKDRIASFGAYHLPALYQELKDDPSIALLPFDSTNAVVTGVRSDSNDYEERAEALRTLKEKGAVHAIVTQGASPAWSDAYKMAMKASLAHRLDCREIPLEQKDALEALMDSFQTQEGAVRQGQESTARGK